MPKLLQQFAPPDLVTYCTYILHEFECDWGSCKAVLNCWWTWRKHILWHSEGNSNNRWQCQLKPCAGSSQLSRDGLHTHLSTNHFGHAPLPCPFQTCNETFQRHNYIEAHLRDDHARFLHDEIFVIPTAALKTTFHPVESDPTNYTPRHDIPNGAISVLSAIPLPVSPNRERTNVQNKPLEEMRWGYWSMPDTQKGSNNESRSVLSPDFMSLDSELEDFVVRPKPPGLRNIGLLLSRPLHGFPNEPQVPPAPPPRSTGLQGMATECEAARRKVEDARESAQ